MQLFKPHAQLIKITDANNPDQYYLHVITNTDLTNYEGDGFSIGTLDQNGILPVTVKLTINQSIAGFEYITPVVHTIDLGYIAFPNGTGSVEVTLQNTAGGSGNGKKNIVRTVDADEDSRPVYNR
ncbi:MAG: hypothetical protein ACKV1O_22005 [Saprospiraceae bacterium]